MLPASATSAAGLGMFTPIHFAVTSAGFVDSGISAIGPLIVNVPSAKAYSRSPPVFPGSWVGAAVLVTSSTGASWLSCIYIFNY